MPECDVLRNFKVHSQSARDALGPSFVDQDLLCPIRLPGMNNRSRHRFLRNRLEQKDAAKRQFFHERVYASVASKRLARTYGVR
jgi:hypothetical protein